MNSRKITSLLLIFALLCVVCLIFVMPSQASTDWRVKISSTLVHTPPYSADCTFGVKEVATSSFDPAFDQIVAPDPAEGVSAWFAYPNDPVSFYRRLSASFIPDSSSLSWNYKVKAVAVDATMNLSWSALEIAAIPSIYNVTLLDYSGTTILSDMRSTTSYTFSAEADATNTFTIRLVATPTPTPNQTPTPTATPNPTPVPTATIIPTASPTPTTTPTPTANPTPTPMSTPTLTPLQTSTNTPNPTQTPTPTPSNIITPSQTPQLTPTSAATPPSTSIPSSDSTTLQTSTPEPLTTTTLSPTGLPTETRTPNSVPNSTANPVPNAIPSDNTTNQNKAAQIPEYPFEIAILIITTVSAIIMAAKNKIRLNRG